MDNAAEILLLRIRRLKNSMALSGPQWEEWGWEGGDGGEAGKQGKGERGL